ncbi:Alpha/beta hydrolase family protein [Corynebacterium comes]|uniref:Alpha/beta hydrolase family protein n=2 Tax=Corynebacterium comes TaxID=2675218 RepID=A0A6B8W3X7_9CORY|nr:Alpha/beta hydrolase family protein [Corynebacterium comes]
MAGTIDYPDSPPIAYAVFAHCFTCSRHVPAASRVCKTLAEHGIAALRFDFPGLGQSEGDFGDTTFTTNVDDIVAASRWLADNHEAPQLLLGHSLGGAAALKAATLPEMASIAAVATLGAPFDPAHSVLHFADRVHEAEKEGSVTVTLAGRDINISREFLEDLADNNPEAYLPTLRKPLMLIHSPVDQTVGVDNAQKIFRVTRFPKSLVTMDKVDHLFTRGDSAQQAGHTIARWARPYLRPSHEAPTVGTDEVRSHVAAGTKYGVVLNSRAGELKADLPKTSGGKGLGHSPVDLLMSALAAASTHAIREAATGMKLDDVEVTIINASRNVFERKIALYGDLSDAQRRRLINAARTSPVEAMLAGAKIMDIPA